MVDYQDPNYFDKGPVFDKMWWVNHHVWATLAMLLNWEFKRPFRMLDVACGKGSLVYYLWRLKLDVWGCDISKHAIDTTPYPLIRDRLFIMDIRKGLDKWVDIGFEVSTCFDILEHIEPKFLDKVISEICRVTERTVFIRMPMADREAPDPHKHGTDEHPSIFTRKEWVERFEKHGFEEKPVDEVLFRVQMIDPNNKVYIPFHNFDTLKLMRKAIEE